MVFSIPPCRTLVLLPTFKHGRFLPARLDSILAQSWRDYHIMVVNDASPDNTAEILEGYRHHPNITVHTRPKNSGSPFAAWQDVYERADSDYLWIAESDDVSAPKFLEGGMRGLQDNPSAAFYYVHSWVTSDTDEITGHTLNYLRQQFPVFDWSRSQKFDSATFNNKAQVYGQALPNMSSAVMRMKAFRAAYDPSFIDFGLAADWAFVGRLAGEGEVLFCADSDNYFRTHQTTSRVRVKLERTCAEYARAIAMIGDVPGVDPQAMMASLERTANMFLYERGSFLRLAQASLKFGVGHNIRLGMKVARHLANRPDLRARVRQYLAPPTAASSAA
jgi:glycosyltransferase involved in cell wall biosynthesis